MKDGHLTYSEVLTYSKVGSVHSTRYNVYRRTTGEFLGRVENRRGLWVGVDYRTNVQKSGRTRRGVADELWGELHV